MVIVSPTVPFFRKSPSLFFQIKQSLLKRKRKKFKKSSVNRSNNNPTTNSKDRKDIKKRTVKTEGCEILYIQVQHGVHKEKLLGIN
jgi:hypothetical protein